MIPYPLKSHIQSWTLQPSTQTAGVMLNKNYEFITRITSKGKTVFLKKRQIARMTKNLCAYGTKKQIGKCTVWLQRAQTMSSNTHTSEGIHQGKENRNHIYFSPWCCWLGTLPSPAAAQLNQRQQYAEPRTLCEHPQHWARLWADRGAAGSFNALFHTFPFTNVSCIQFPTYECS